MERSLIDQRKRRSVTSSEIEDRLLKSSTFINILNSLTLYVNDNKKIVICNSDYIELSEERLLKIFSEMNQILEARYNFTENLSTLRELLWRSIDDEGIERITARKEELDHLERDPENREYKVRKVIEDLEAENLEFITYEQIIEALKNNFNLVVSSKSNSLSKFLKDLGYHNKRITVDGKKIRVWVK